MSKREKEHIVPLQPLTTCVSLGDLIREEKQLLADEAYAGEKRDTYYKGGKVT